MLTEAMSDEQREEFDRLLAEQPGTDDSAARRAYALAYGELD